MRATLAVLTSLLIHSASPAAAADLDDALFAYLRGDYENALRVLVPLAEQGDAEAQFALGEMYDFGGDGMFEDNAQAATWYSMAAEQGVASAQFFLGGMYFHGEGVPEDYVQAYAWTSIAAARGDTDAKAAKDFMSSRMTDEQIAEAQELSTEFWERYVVPFLE